MVAASRFLASTAFPKPIVVVNGSDQFLRQTVIRAVQQRRSLARTVTVPATEYPTRALAGLTHGDLLVYAGCERQDPALLDAILYTYLDASLPHTGLLVTDERPGVPTPRHFAERKDVQQIDLPKRLAQPTLIALACACGVPAREAETLVIRLHDDPELVVAALDRLRTVPRPWTVAQIRALSASAAALPWYESFDVLQGDAQSLCAQLQRRFLQLAQLAACLPLNLDPAECCRRAGIARVQYLHLRPLAKRTSAQLWLQRAQHAGMAAALARRGFADADRWLKAACGI